MPDWESRYYSYDSHWTPGEMMASMRDGSGDEYFILFTGSGAILKGFAHESPMAQLTVDHGKPWPGVLDGVPAEFSSFLFEPAFSIAETTFCTWWLNHESGWQIGPVAFPPAHDPDGSENLLSILDGDPKTYQAWAEEYYEAPVFLPLVRHIYTHQPLREHIIQGLNPEIDLELLSEDIATIGYLIGE